MRKSNSIKNLLTNLIPFFILTILGFFRVNVFLKELGIEIFSLNQLFLQIFAYISLAESGIGALINQQYYKLLVNNNKQKINELYTSSKKMFANISIIIIVLGLIVSVFLSNLTNNSLSLGYMQFVFMLFLIRSVLEYLFFPPRIIMQADQKMYKTNLIYNFYRILEILLEIVSLLFGANYVTVLIITIIIRIIMFVRINKKVFKEYPWLTTIKNKSNIKIKGIKDIMGIKLAGVAYDNTDVILISAFLQPIQVTIFVSYNYIINFLNDFSYMIYSSMLASFGNILNKESFAYKKKVFEEINIMFLTLATIFSVITFASINTFISLWVGEDKVISMLTLYCFIVLLFYNVAKKPLLIQRDAEGLFKQTAKANIIEAILTITFSFLLIKKLGIVGVLLGKLLASLLTNFWYLPRLIYEKYKQTPFNYFWKLTYHIILSICLCCLGTVYYNLTVITSFINWFIYTALFSLFIVFIVLAFEYITSNEFKSLFKKIVSMLRKKDKYEKEV